ncbi:MAG: ABC transporter permease [Acidimicrobiales bacterium]
MIGVELRKQVRRLRTYIALGAMVVVPAIITTAFALGGRPHHHPGDPATAALVLFATRSGLNMPLAALSTMSPFLLVVVVALFGGETVAGEAGWGTLRYLLVRPVGRPRLLTAKLAIAGLLTVIATVLIVAVGLLAGTLAFGWHPVTIPGGIALPASTALVRLGISTLYVIWEMSGVLSFAFLLSVMTDSPIGATAGGIGLAIVSEILDGISALGSVRIGFPTHDWQAWNGLFVSPTQTSEMLRGALVQVPYVAVFLGVAWWWFGRKDILS